MASAIPLLLLGGAVLLLGGKKKKKSTGGGKAVRAGNFYSVNGMDAYKALVGQGALRGGVVTALLTGTGDAAISAAMKAKAATSPHIKFLVARGSDAKGLALEFNQAAGPGWADPNGALLAAFKPSQNTSGDPMAAYMSDAEPLVQPVRSGKEPGPTKAVASAVRKPTQSQTGLPSDLVGRTIGEAACCASSLDPMGFRVRSSCMGIDLYSGRSAGPWFHRGHIEDIVALGFSARVHKRTLLRQPEPGD